MACKMITQGGSQKQLCRLGAKILGNWDSPVDVVVLMYRLQSQNGLRNVKSGFFY